MGDISKDFDRKEFACQCGCGFDTVDAELIEALQDVRDHYVNCKVTITSGCRCPAHNARIGGSKGSKHMEGRAADFKVEATHPDEVYQYLVEKYPGKWGIGTYPTWNHLDTRTVSIWRKDK